MNIQTSTKITDITFRNEFSLEDYELEQYLQRRTKNGIFSLKVLEGLLFRIRASIALNLRDKTLCYGDWDEPIEEGPLFVWERDIMITWESRLAGYLDTNPGKTLRFCKTR